MDLKIDESNVLLYAARFYDNPNCFDTDEFHEDLKRVSYIKRLFNKYSLTGDIKVQLAVNHLIVLYNVFGDFASKILFVKLSDYLDVLIPFLIVIGKCPERVENIGVEGETIITDTVVLEPNIVSILKQRYEDERN